MTDDGREVRASREIVGAWGAWGEQMYLEPLKPRRLETDLVLYHKHLHNLSALPKVTRVFHCYAIS